MLFGLYTNMNFFHPSPVLESIKKSSTLESSTLAISTLYLEGEERDHTCAVSDVPSRVELSCFIDSSPVPKAHAHMPHHGEKVLY